MRGFEMGSGRAARTMRNKVKFAKRAHPLIYLARAISRVASAESLEGTHVHDSHHFNWNYSKNLAPPAPDFNRNYSKN